MRLINTETYELEQVPSYGSNDAESDSTDRIRPPYAILSHKWRQGELSFQDMSSYGEREKRAGWTKLTRCCDRARQDGLNFAWIDTCCINKDSHTELTEAINSMFSWYSDAAVCYLYIDDVGPQLETKFELAEIWTRGWCLQELIAPSSLICFDRDWTVLGHRSDLKDSIASATGIDLNLLAGTRPLYDYSVAQRMSWAARRKTTRPEDRAYSLIGIFDVSMPMIYGEGAEKAFLRLQGEIIMGSDDHSIFAWSGVCIPNNCGLLARSPSSFADCGRVRSISARHDRQPFSLTNRGVSIILKMTPWAPDTYHVLLNCETTSTLATEGQLGIYLRRLHEDDAYVRVTVDGNDLVVGACISINDAPAWHINTRQIFTYEWDYKNRKVNVQQRKLTHHQMAHLSNKIYGFQLSESLLAHCSIESVNFVISKGCTYDRELRVITRMYGAPADKPLLVAFVQGSSLMRCLSLFIDQDFNPVCFLAEPPAVHLIPPEMSPCNSVVRLTEADADQDSERREHFLHRSTDSQYGWNWTFGDARTMVLPNELREGLWKIRGDREDGISATLICRYKPRIEISVEMKQKVMPGGTIWYVDVHNLGATDFR